MAPRDDRRSTSRRTSAASRRQDHQQPRGRGAGRSSTRRATAGRRRSVDELAAPVLGTDPRLRRRRPAAGASAATSSSAASNSRDAIVASAADVARRSRIELTYEAGKAAQDRRLRPPRAGLGVPEQPGRRRDQPDLQAAARRADPRGDRRARAEEPSAADEARRGDRALPQRGEAREKNGKKTNKALYAWMKREVKGLYAQCFQFAFDIAQEGRARAAARARRPEPELPPVRLPRPARKGCWPARSCYLDLKRMEMAYHELNQREYELTKHVSLLQVEPAGAAAAARHRPLHRRRCPRRSSTWTVPATTSAASSRSR